MEGRVEVILRGRPARDQFDDFGRQVAEAPHLVFAGPYRNPEDSPRIYGDVHFTWLPDFFEAGMNSQWLLPNRLYEGCCYSTVPLAMAGTETARFLEEKRPRLHHGRAERRGAVLGGGAWTMRTMPRPPSG